MVFSVGKFVYFTALDSTQSELFDVKAKFDEMAAARYFSRSALVTVYLYLTHSLLEILLKNVFWS